MVRKIIIILALVLTSMFSYAQCIDCTPQELQEVFEKIRRSYGIKENEIEIKFISRKNTTIYARCHIEERRKRINFGEDLYVLIKSECKKNKKDLKTALAFIVSHELAHAKLNHHGAVNIVSANLSNEATKQEADADLYGSFYAHQAGYKTIEIYDDVLDWIYKANNLSAKQRGYEDLDSRKVGFDKTFAHFKKTILPKVTEANNCIAKKKFWDAKKIFEGIINENGKELDGFKNAALYNNVAVCILNQMIFKEGILPSKYKELSFPFAYESEPVGVLRNIDQNHNVQLDKAHQNLIKALELDPNYEPAQINNYWVALLRFMINDKKNTDTKELINQIERIKRDSKTGKDNKNKLFGLYYTIVWMNNMNEDHKKQAEKYLKESKQNSNLKLLKSK